MSDTAIIICSRVKSSRLPQKVFKMINGVQMIEHLLKRVTVTGIPTVLAIPNGERQYYNHLSHYPITIVEGDALSPLHRICDYLKQHRGIKYVVRVTHDDPIIDAQTVSELLAEVKKADAGYGCTPDIIEGAGVEIMHRENLLEASKRKENTEFISYFVKGSNMPKPTTIKMQPRHTIQRPYRLTIDFPEDADLLEIVFRSLGNDCTVDEICKYLDLNQHLLNINKLPLLTVYTCVHNAEETIYTTMQSVLNTDINMEYIIVDDKSTDKSIMEMTKFCHDKRVKYIFNDKNLGLASSSNRAIDKARGKYITRVDADDLLMADNFKVGFFEAVNLLNRKAEIVYPAYYSYYEESGEYTYTKPDLKHHAGCAIMTLKMINELRFKDGIRHWDGLDLYHRILKDGVSYYSKPTWFYRVHKDSMSNTNLEHRASTKLTIDEMGNVK